MRQIRSLSGQWQFQIDPQGALQVGQLSPDRDIPVPMPWQAAFPELQQYSGYAWYRQQITLDQDWLDGELLLTFGAVDYWCQVYINEQLAAEHEGGYTPFTIPISQFVHAGENEIAVRVYDSVQQNITIPRWPDHHTPDSAKAPFDARNVPHGKQEWYVNVGGIWQDVTLTAVPAVHVGHIQVTPNIHNGRVVVTLEVHGDTRNVSGHNLIVRIDGAGIEQAVPLASRQAMYTVTLQVSQPHLWNVNDPHLYTVTASLKNGQEYDTLQTRFGFREIMTKDGQLLLNGAPLFLLSALDQDLYPDTIYTVPSREFIQDQFTKAKQLGLNSLRCHIKPPDPVYLDLADEMGLLIWTEIPSWRTFYQKTTIHPQTIVLDETIKARVSQTLKEMLWRDYNHPSIIAWTIVNEDWGTTLPMSASDRAWVAEMYDLCKRLDPTRLVVDNSPCPVPWGASFHIKSDLDDFHIYANIPDQADGFVQIAEQFALRPLWSYSNYDDSTRTGKEPLIISEIGNWGLPSLKALKADNGKEPDWFNLGPWWASWEGEPGWPSGVDTRFKSLGLDKIWPDYESFATATQWHQYEAMKFEIETMRRLPHMSGYVLTEFTDAYWESNGLLDFHRNTKVYHQEFASINTEDVLVPQLNTYTYWDDDLLTIRVHGSHYSSADWTGAQLQWKIGEVVGQQMIQAVERGTVKQLIQQNWKLPYVDQSRYVPLELTLQGADGLALASNKVTLLILPSSARKISYPDEVAVLMHTPGKITDSDEFSGEGDDVSSAPSDRGFASGDLSISNDPKHATRVTFMNNLEALGYNTTKQITGGTRVIVTDYPNEDMLQWVRNGGDMLFLSRGPGPFFWRQGRTGTYGGSWINAFSWIRPQIHQRLPISNPLKLPMMQIMPTGTLLGLPVDDERYHGDMLAGQVSGWLQHPAVHTVQFRYGKGRVIMTTFGIRQALQDNPADPAAVAMLHDLIAYLTSPACQPALTANY